MISPFQSTSQPIVHANRMPEKIILSFLYSAYSGSGDGDGSFFLQSSPIPQLNENMCSTPSPEKNFMLDDVQEKQVIK